jgi:hypothetical protein
MCGKTRFLILLIYAILGRMVAPHLTVNGSWWPEVESFLHGPCLVRAASGPRGRAFLPLGVTPRAGQTEAAMLGAEGRQSGAERGVEPLEVRGVDRRARLGPEPHPVAPPRAAPDPAPGHRHQTPTTALLDHWPPQPPARSARPRSGRRSRPPAREEVGGTPGAGPPAWPGPAVTGRWSRSHAATRAWVRPPETSPVTTPTHRAGPGAGGRRRCRRCRGGPEGRAAGGAAEARLPVGGELEVALSSLAPGRARGLARFRAVLPGGFRGVFIVSWHGSVQCYRADFEAFLLSSAGGVKTLTFRRRL